MKRITFILALMLTTATMMAEDFRAGDMYVYFNIIGDNAVEVTFRGEKYSSYQDEYFGNLVIPDSVVHNGKTYHVLSIGQNAFSDCEALSTVVIPNSVVSISSAAFYSSSVDSIVIGKGVKSIGQLAFYYCDNLTSITIPNNVRSLGSGAFQHCKSLTSVHIGSGLKNISYSVFEGCTLLKSIVVDSNNSIYDSRDNCNAIIETATNTLILGCKNTHIPESVTSIGENAFRGRKSLTSITIPNGVKSIGSGAFKSCDNLTSITIPEGVTTIGYEAFEYCNSLTSVTIPSTVTRIVQYAFWGCESLTTVTIPSHAQVDLYTFPAHTQIIRQ